MGLLDRRQIDGLTPFFRTRWVVWRAPAANRQAKRIGHTLIAYLDSQVYPLRPEGTFVKTVEHGLGTCAGIEDI